MINTAEQLIAFLKTVPGDATIISTEPPFTGVVAVLQENGKVLIAPPPRETVGVPVTNPLAE